MGKIKKVECMVCGKEFEVLIDEDGTIHGDIYYYGMWRPEIGNWVALKLEDGEFVRACPVWKELYYRLIDLIRIIFRLYIEVELWICKECDEAWEDE